MNRRESSPMISTTIAATTIIGLSAANSGRNRPDAPRPIAIRIQTGLIGGWRWIRTTTGIAALRVRPLDRLADLERAGDGLGDLDVRPARPPRRVARVLRRGRPSRGGAPLRRSGWMAWGAGAGRVAVMGGACGRAGRRTGRVAATADRRGGAVARPAGRSRAPADRPGGRRGSASTSRRIATTGAAANSQIEAELAEHDDRRDEQRRMDVQHATRHPGLDEVAADPVGDEVDDRDRRGRDRPGDRRAPAGAGRTRGSSPAPG